MANNPPPTPRLTAPYLSHFPSQTVRLIGKVLQLRGETAVVDAGGEVIVHLNRDSHLIPGNAVEIVGKVQGDLSVRVLMATDFGANLDFAAVEKVVECSMRWKEIFYDAGDS